MKSLLQTRLYLGLFLFFSIFFGVIFFWQLGMFALPLVGASRQNLPPHWTEILFGGTSSVLLGLLLTGFSSMFLEARTRAIKGEATLSGMALLMATLVFLCPVCNVGIFLLFGVALNLSFLAPYVPFLQVMSVLLFLWALYLLDKKIRNHCLACEEGNSCKIK